jgi:lipoate-protein ligase A
MTTARLLLDSPAAGAGNMAVDEALLQSARERATPTLRFYTWKTATLSLGYFQAHAQRSAHSASSKLPLVRRATGGGAIVHHHELTYSFVAPLTDRLSADAESLYYAFHETLIDCLGIFGVAARLCGTPVVHPRGAEPFLCFQRRAKGDVLCGDAKITGSAQRRHHGAVLQHGSVLLVQSPHTPELPGVAELSGRVLSIPELMTAWTPALATRLGLELEPGALTDEEQAAATAIESDKFAAASWNERR